MPKKPEENKKPTHGAKPENGLLAPKKHGEQTPADHSAAVITHKHEKKARVERDCTKCKYATQVSANEWECSREHYFPQTLICFVAREEAVVVEEVVE